MEICPPLNLCTTSTLKVNSNECKLDYMTESFFINSDSSQTIEICNEVNSNYVLLQSSVESIKDKCIKITGEMINDKTIIVSEESSQEKGNDEVGYNCLLCPKSFSRASRLRLHEKSHLEDKNVTHECDQCCLIFPRLSLLLRHRYDHARKNCECLECGLNFNSYQSLRMHSKNHKNNKRHKCPNCSMTFVQHSHLITHLRKHTGEKPFQCHICSVCFKQVSHLTSHIRTHTNDRPFRCDYCGASFSQTGSLKRHIRSHTGEKPFKCEQCNVGFVEKRNLTRHQLSHSGVKPFVCDLCSAKFSQLIDLKRHKYSHSGIKPFKCNICEAAFSRKNNLKFHKLTHEGDTPHICDICNVGFRIARDLRNHRRSHNSIKAYKCLHCDASFSALTTLKRHMVSHTGNKAFSCEICNSSFFEKSTLKRHLQRHNNDKPFTCEYCSTSFFELRALKRHRLVVHNVGKYEDMEANRLSVLNKEIGHCSKTASLIEEENSLHIYEPSHSRPSRVCIVNASTSRVKDKEVVENNQVMDGVIMTDQSSPHGSQIPTLVLAQQGQAPKLAKLALNCQNHSSHVHTLVEGTQVHWQTWCFCENPKVQDNNDFSFLPEIAADLHPASDIHDVIDQSQNIGYHMNIKNQSDANCDIVSCVKSKLPNRIVDYVSSPNEEPLHDKIVDDSYKQGIFTAVQQLALNTSSAYQQDTHVHSNSYSTLSSISGNSLYKMAEHKNSEPIVCHTKNNSVYIKEKKKTEIETLDYIANGSIGKVSAQSHCANDVKRSNHSSLKADKLLFPEIIQSTSINCDQTLQDDTTSINNECNNIVEICCSNEKELASILLDGDGLLKRLPDKCNGSNLKRSMFSNYFEDGKPFSSSNQIESGEPRKSPELLSIDSNTNALSLVSESSRALITNEVEQGTLLNSISNKSSHETLSPKHVGLAIQYSQTINNPETGDIRIQSASFETKSVGPKTLNSLVKKRKNRKCMTSNQSNKIIKCHLCPKLFRKNNHLEMHMRVHTGEKPYICGLCNQCFAHNNSLTIHMRCHTGERPFCCTYCGATFTQKGNLRVHHRTHTGEKPFECDICNSSFSQGSHLTAHKRIHNNDRPYVCKTCDHAFTQRSALNRHQMKHLSMKEKRPHLIINKFDSSLVNLSKKNIVSMTNKGDIIHASKEVYDFKTHLYVPQMKVDDFNDMDKGEHRFTSNKQVITELNVKSKVNPVENVKKMGLKERKKTLGTKRVKRSARNIKNYSDVEEFSLNLIDDSFVENSDHAYQGKLKSTLNIFPAEPIRSSKRLREASRKINKNSDFITGDLDEIDEMEDILIEVNKKEVNIKAEQKQEAEDVNSWCFCEVPHNPDRPHTTNSLNEGTKTDVHAKIIDNNLELNDSANIVHNISFEENCKGSEIFDFSLGQIESTMILKGEEPVRMECHQDEQISTRLSIDPQDIVLNSGVQNHALTQNSGLITSAKCNMEDSGEQIVTVSSEVINSVTSENSESIKAHNNDVYDLTASSQIISRVQYVTSEGTFYIDAGDIINSNSVVVNPVPGTIYLNISSQVLNISPNQTIDESNLNMVVKSSNLMSGLSSGESIYTLAGQSVTLPTESVSILPLELQSIRNVEENRGTLTYNNHQQIAISSDTNLGETFEQIPTVETCDKSKLCEYEEFSKNDHHSIKSNAIIVTPYKCTVCGKCFAQKITIKKHMEDEHSSLFFCRLCFDVFETKENLINHKLTHGSHPCGECNLVLTNKIALNKHKQRIHKTNFKGGVRSEERSFSCVHCQSRFYQLSDLKRHLLSHTGEKPFQCQQCGVCFTRKSSLNKHSRIHTGARPYVCVICDKTFAYRYQFNRHKSSQCKEDPNPFPH